MEDAPLLCHVVDRHAIHILKIKFDKIDVEVQVEIF